MENEYEFEIGLSNNSTGERWSCQVRSSVDEQTLNDLFLAGLEFILNDNADTINIEKLAELNILSEEEYISLVENGKIPVNAAFNLMVGLAKLVDGKLEVTQLESE